MSTKLVVVADSRQANFFKAVGLKIKSQLKHLEFNSDKSHVKNELREGFFSKATTSSHFFDPHTVSKDLDRLEFGKDLLKEIDKTLNEGNYDSIIIAAAPKMLSTIRKKLPTHLEKILYKEIDKDLTRNTVEEVEEVIFN